MEVVPIFQAVRAGGDVLSQFIDVARRYLDLPMQVSDIRHSIRGCEHALKSWEKRWGVAERRPTAYYEMFWGRNGWEEIRDCLGSIRQICRRVNEEIDGLVECATVHNKTRFRPEVYAKRLDETLVQESVKRISKRMGRWRRFRKALINQAVELEDQIRRFEKELRALRRMSNGNAETMHGEKFLKIRHLRGKEFILRLTGQDLSSYQKARKDAELLHEASQSSRAVASHIGFTVLNQSNRGLRESPPRRRAEPQAPVPNPDADFQLLIDDHGVWSEVLIHPVRFSGNPTRSEFCSSLSETLSKCLGPRSECYLLPPSSSFDEGFIVRKANNARLGDLESRRDLHAQLGVHGERDKMLIASTLAEGCYRLLGTPWLDYLDGRNIRTMPVASDSWAALLKACPGDSRTTEILARMAHTFRRGNHGLTHHCHIYRLGLLLIEIGLGQPITYVVYQRTIGVKVVLSWTGSDESLNANSVAAEVENEMGQKYGDVVYFCLSVLQDHNLLNERDFDQNFAIQVLEP